MAQDPWRVAVVAPPFYDLPPRHYGGSELICYLLAEGLVARGHDVTLIGAGSSRTAARFVATFTEPQPEDSDDARRIEALHFVRSSALVADLAPDVVHDHTTLGLRLGGPRRGPVVATVHHALRGPDSVIGLSVTGAGVRPVAISQAQRRDAPDLSWEATVPNGIDVDGYPLRRDKEDFALYLGRLSRHKGVHVAIDAARAAGIRLVVAGSWTVPEERHYFYTEIRPRLGRDVEWIGPVGFQEKVELLGSAACVLFPAQWHEPFGLVLVEAQACGTPVIALDAGAVREVVDDGVTGFVCQVASQLPSAIRQARDIDPDRCRGYVTAYFTAAHMVTRYEGVYRRVLDASAARG